MILLILVLTDTLEFFEFNSVAIFKGIIHNLFTNFVIYVPKDFTFTIFKLFQLSVLTSLFEIFAEMFIFFMNMLS